MKRIDPRWAWTIWAMGGLICVMFALFSTSPDQSLDFWLAYIVIAVVAPGLVNLVYQNKRTARATVLKSFAGAIGGQFFSTHGTIWKASNPRVLAPVEQLTAEFSPCYPTASGRPERFGSEAGIVMVILYEQQEPLRLSLYLRRHWPTSSPLNPETFDPYASKPLTEFSLDDPTLDETYTIRSDDAATAQEIFADNELRTMLSRYKVDNVFIGGELADTYMYRNPRAVRSLLYLGLPSEREPLQTAYQFGVLLTKAMQRVGVASTISPHKTPLAEDASLATP